MNLHSADTNQQAAFNQKQSTSVHACTASQAKPTHSFKHSCIWLTALVYFASYSRSSSRTRSLILHALTFTLSTCSHAKEEFLLSLSPSHSHLPVLPLSWTSRTEVEDHNLRISRGVEPTNHEGEYARSDDPQARRNHLVCMACTCPVDAHAHASSPHTNQLQRYQLYSRGVKPAAHKGK